MGSPLTPLTAPSWPLWLSANWPIILLWNEARGLLHVWQVWAMVWH